MALKADKRHKQRVASALTDQKRIAGSQKMQQEAELLKSCSHLVKKGSNQIAVVDYYQSPPQEIVILLHKSQSLTQQIDKRFRDSKRLMLAQPKNQARLDFLAKESVCVNNLLLHIDAVESQILDHPQKEQCASSFQEWERSLSVIEAALRLLEPSWFSDSKKAIFHHSKQGVQPRAKLPYRIYYSSSRRAIWVGTSALENDKLTFYYAPPHSDWFHVSGFTGSHVVIPRRAQELVDKDTIFEAARLAAFFSKAPRHVYVEVAWTQVKYVKKTKGAKPGTVIISQEKQLRINNDISLIKQLIHH